MGRRQLKEIIALVAFATVTTGCGARPPKTCHELRSEFTGVSSKQILFTDKPLKESYSFRKILL